MAFPKANYLANPGEVSPKEVEEIYAVARQATSHLEDARKYGYNHPQLSLYLVLSLAYQNRYGDAVAKIDEFFAEVKRLEERVTPNSSGCGVGFSRLRAEGYWYRGYMFYLKALVTNDAKTKNNLLQTAEGHFLQSISLKEDHVGSHWMLGLVYGTLEKYPQSIEQYKKAILFTTEEPVKALLYDSVAMAFSVLGRFDEALINHQEAIRKQPNKAPLYHGLAATYMSMGKLEDALVQLKKGEELRASESSSDGSNVYYSLGVAYGIRFIKKRNEQDFTDAVNALTKMIELRPKFAGSYDTLGAFTFSRATRWRRLRITRRLSILTRRTPTII